MGYGLTVEFPYFKTRSNFQPLNFLPTYVVTLWLLRSIFGAWSAKAGRKFKTQGESKSENDNDIKNDNECESGRSR